MEQISRKIILLQKLVKNLTEIFFVQIASGDIDRDRKAAETKISTLFQDPGMLLPICIYPPRRSVPLFQSCSYDVGLLRIGQAQVYPDSRDR